MAHIDEPAVVGKTTAAEGIEKIDVAAVNRKETRELYAGRKKIYAKRAKGYYRSIKWLVMAVTLTIYYATPWLRWERGPGLPEQAILFDVAHGRIFLFDLEIWPQELYLITGFLILSALALFLFTAIAGRVWCGYLCWQTVWTDLMIAVERFWQGDRNARIRLDKSPWNVQKVYKKSMTHLSWILISIATGGAFVFYFRDAPTLAQEFLTGTAPMPAVLFAGMLTFFTYLMGGIAREQVCIYMCPWPRIQGAMFDHDSLLISYHDGRGEPRGPHRKRESWDNRGDCIDCNACVAVCPMGIDIRDGSQLECIQCALCIDACNDIMTRIGRPLNLIAYDTFRGLEQTDKPTANASAYLSPEAQTATSSSWAAGFANFKALDLRLVRPRTVLYSSLIAVVSAIMIYAVMAKSILDMNIIPHRNPYFVKLSDGGIRNTYTIKILNKLYEERTFYLALEGLPGAKLTVLGMENEANPAISVVPDDLRDVRIFVSVPANELSGISKERHDFTLIARDSVSGHKVRNTAIFRRPPES